MAGSRSRVFGVALLAALAVGGLAYSQEHHSHREHPRVEPTSAQRAQKPNIIVLESDDQSVSQFQRSIMPNTFREIVDSGTTLSQMVATPPLCCPSRAATITGDYPHNNGVVDNGRRAYPKLVDKENVLPLWLQKAGYRTGLVGKFIDGYARVGGHAPAPGWDHWFMFGKPRSYWGPTILDGHRFKKYGSHRYLTNVLNKDANRFVRTHVGKKNPFFLWYAPWAPHKAEADGADRNAPVCAKDGKPLPLPSEYKRFKHTPVPDLSTPSFNESDVSDKPAPFNELASLSSKKIRAVKDRWRCGAAALATFDRGVGEIVRTLRKAGELDNTMFVYTSDNGVSFGEHRIPHGKIRPTNEADRVPTVIRPAASQIRPQKATSDEPVGMVDVAPTLLDAAGARPCNAGGCRTIDGTSMWPLLLNPEARSWDSGRGLLLELDHNNCSYTAIRTTAFTYVRYRDPVRRAKPPLTCPGGGGSEFYDRAKDPYELHNLAAAHGLRSLVSDAFTGTEIARRLHRLETCSGHPGTQAPNPCE
jgi:arylsulfatase A-like enzyme